MPPSWKFVLAQMTTSGTNWMVMGMIIWLLLGQNINCFFVFSMLLMSNIAGVIAYIPAGIGVLEMVLMALLVGENTSQGVTIAVLLTYHILYYLIPLLLALMCYLPLENRAEKLQAKNKKVMTK